MNHFLAILIVIAALSPETIAIELDGEGSVFSDSIFDDYDAETTLGPPSSGHAPAVENVTPEGVGISAVKLQELMRPNVSFGSEWQAETNDIGLDFHNARVSIPTYPWFGPPPPFINMGFAFTNIDAPATAGLPGSVYETELGLGWMRKLSDRWMMRYMASASFATDGNNKSSDAWRFRGGVFALYRRNSNWTWTFGAIALGRNDLPVVPAVGVIYQPNSKTRFDLMMPRPRLSRLLVDHGSRQQWGYIGASLNGATWGVERMDGAGDQLTYGDFRVVLGWESTPTPEPGIPFTRGRKLGAEIGYVFSRDFEWEDYDIKLRLSDALMMRATLSF